MCAYICTHCVCTSSNGICVFTFIFGCLPVARKDTDSIGTMCVHTINISNLDE